MRRQIVPALLVAALLVLVGTACSSGSSSSSTTTQKGKSFQVSTADGEVSLSLDGQLPSGWPSDFPVPSDAKPAGSGSLASSNQNVMVAVYDSTGSPSDAFDFYKGSSALTVESSRSVGVGSAYVGSVKFSGTFGGSAMSGRVTIVSVGSGARIVVVLQPS